jgi:hypothetical protein
MLLWDLLTLPDVKVKYKSELWSCSNQVNLLPTMALFPCALSLAASALLDHFKRLRAQHVKAAGVVG